MRDIVLIGCSKKKSGQKIQAERMYKGTLFSLALRYARLLSPDAIFVLSAKYGLLELAREIEPYDLTLKTMKTSLIEEWAAMVVEQMRTIGDLEHDRWTFLAGERYWKYLIPHLGVYATPLRGLSQGRQLHYLKTASPSGWLK